MHWAAYHFIKAFSIPSSINSKWKLTEKTPDNDGNTDEDATEDVEADNDEADIDISMGIDTSADDMDAMIGTTITSYDPGVGNGTGNPGVFQGYPYPNPSLPAPAQ